MMSIFWTFCAYVMFPTACVALFLMLSGFGPLERLGCSICCADVKVGTMKCNVLVFFVLLSCVGFLTSLYGVEKYERLRKEGTDHVSLDDRYKLQLFRDQRNWWISGCNLILWLVCWRVQALMRWKNTVTSSAAPAAPGTSDKDAKKPNVVSETSKPKVPEEPKKVR
ncbi:unnamed protein product [Amoebophrya sp. A120]|nr:unnamed protein product [Amoebophrya sp. A120]|eukprot:GSA120T00017801001.1